MEDELQQQFFVNVTPTDDQELDTTPSWDKPDTLMSPKSSTCSNHKHQEIISSNHIPATSRTPEEASESVKTLSFPLSDENRSTDLDSNKDTNHTNSHSHLYYNHCPSNKRLLGTACISFMGFASFQMVFAFVAGSQSMLGDSAAMMVDAFTYGFNYLAEQQKNRDDKSSSKSTDVLSFRDRIRLNRKRNLRWELIPPLVSVVTLTIVTAFVLRHAIQVLILDAHHPTDNQNIPNVTIMLTFSIINLAIDVLNIFCFAKAKHLLGYATVEPKITPDRRVAKESWNSTQQMEESMTKEMRHIQGERYDEDDTIKEGFAHSHHDGINLNMCSAYTHVFADTLRSLAVILAAGIALTVHSVTPEVADASAAVVVSDLILVSLVPLVRGLTWTASELCAIAAEERQLTRKVDLLQSSRTTTAVDMGQAITAPSVAVKNCPC